MQLRSFINHKEFFDAPVCSARHYVDVAERIFIYHLNIPLLIGNDVTQNNGTSA